MRRAIRNLLARAHRRATGRVAPNNLKLNRCRLQLSPLEDRTVPATFTVNLTTDASGTVAGTGDTVTMKGDLRFCIQQADALAGADVIVFDASVFTADTTIAINPAVGNLAADGSLTIDNSTGKVITLDGGNQTRVLRLNFVANPTVYTVNNLVLTNGNGDADGTGAGVAGDGGALLAATTSENSAAAAAGLTVNLNRCTISNSTTPLQGGGIALGNDANINIIDCTISGNSAPTTGVGGGAGGGIYCSAFGITHIERSTMTGNSANGSVGGAAIYFFGGKSTDRIEIINSTISGNTAFTFGGGMALYRFSGGTLLISNSTVVNNASAPGGGDGVSIDFTTNNAKVIIQSSIVNANGSNDIIDNGVNTAITVNSSLVGNLSGFTIDTTDGKNLAPGTDPMLKVLGNYGGPTQTHEPMTGSPVLDVGSNPLSLALDQRGGARSFGDTDMGAVEVFAAGAPTAAATVSNITVSGGNTQVFTVTYTDDVEIDTTTIGAGDIRVIGPGGVFNVLATFDMITASSMKSATAQYHIASNPAGSVNWDFFDNGTYGIRVEPGQVKDKAGNNVPSGTVASFDVSAPRPVGSLVATNVNSPTVDFTFQVTYVGVNTKVSLASLGDNDVRVKNAALSFDAAAKFVSADKGSDNSTITATYKVTGPGGSWDINGERGQTFTVEVQSGAVVDADNTPVATGSVGGFAAFLIVDSLFDTSDGDFSVGNFSIREAIEIANATSDPNDIITFDEVSVFNVAQSIAFSGTIFITGGLTIDGPSKQLTFDGQGVNQLFSATGKAGAETTITFKDLRMFNATAGTSQGGTIVSDGCFVSMDNVKIQGMTGALGTGIWMRNDLGGTKFGLSMTNCEVSNNIATLSQGTGGFRAGVVVLDGSGDLTLINCNFHDNENINPDPVGTYQGGAIWTANMANVLIQDCKFTNNKSDNSVGAVLVAAATGTVTVRGTSFTGNITDGGAGALSIQSGTSGGARLVENCTFTNNSAGTSGGALLLNETVSATVRNCVFIGNEANRLAASSGGGAISIQALGLAIPLTVERIIEGCTFENNKSTLATGGAITHFAGGTVILRNSTLSGNTAATGGGAIRLVSATATQPAAFIIQNTTIAFNTTTTGATISQANTANASLSIESSIVAKNTQTGVGDIVSSLPVGLTNSLIGNGDGVTFMTSGTTFVGTTALQEDPGFVGGLASNGSTQPGNKTYAISMASKVYNQGSNPASLMTDQRGAGFNRVSGGKTDMGSFELQVVVPPTVTSIVVDDNSGQRSMVRSLVVNFSEAVNFTAGAFTLTQYFNGAGTVGLTLNPASGPASSVTITFTNVGGTVLLDPQGSLPDGKFELKINAANVSTMAGTLDGNGNGMSEGSPTDDVTFQTHRLFGDGNGDGTVTAADFNAFRLVYGSPGPSSFDYDGGGVSASDFNAFRLRYGASGFLP